MDLCELRNFNDGTRHPWERARLRLVTGLLRAGGLSAHESRLLDVGCGDGFVANNLAAHAASTIGVDPNLSDEDLANLSQRYPAVTFQRELPDGQSADAVTLLDVLEHVPDDVALLTDAAACLTPGGSVLITVPAHPSLFSEHDRNMSHFRRYTRNSLLQLIEDAGLDVVEHGYLFGMLLPWRVMQVLRERMRAAAKRPTDLTAWSAGETAASLTAAALLAEGRLLTTLAKLGIRLPGLSLWAHCRKRH